MKHNADVQNDHEIKYYTTYCTRPGTSISLLMFNQYFDLGYQLLMSIDNHTKRAHCFIHNFYYSVVSIDRYKDLLKFIVKQDPELTITDNLFAKLLAFILHRGMYYNAYEICQISNRFDEAAEAAINIFHVTSKIQTKTMYCGWADYFLQRAMLLRDGHEVCHPPYRPSSMTIEDLSARKQLLVLQLSVINMCLQHKIEFTDDFDIMFNPKAMVNVGAHFLMFKEFDKICRYMPKELHNLDEIVSQLAILLAKHYRRHQLLPEVSNDPVQNVPQFSQSAGDEMQMGSDYQTDSAARE